MNPTPITHPEPLPFQDPGVLHDENADLIALWCLRILVHLGGQKELLGLPGLHNDNILRSLGLAHLGETEIDASAARRLLRHRLGEAERRSPKPVGALADNLAHAKEVLGLSETDELVLAFAALMESDSGLDDTGDTLGHKLTDQRFARALAVTLAVPLEEVYHSLSPRGVLIGSGLFTLDHSPERLAVKLRLVIGYGNALRGKHECPEDLFANYLRTSDDCRVTLADFPHLDAALPLLRREIERALQRREKGCNLLLYGGSGTGKTQLSRALAAAVGAELFEVPTESIGSDLFNPHSPTNAPIAPDDRIDAYRLCQQILGRRKGCLVLFDEIEDVFPSPLQGLYRRSPPPKGWLNELLETNAVPTIWVSNQIAHLDPAAIRRFSLVVELGNPTRNVRRNMLQNSLGTSGVRPEWLDRMAENEHLAPALIEQAGYRAAVLAGEPTALVEESIERMLGSTLDAMGLPRKATNPNRELIRYRLDCLNPDEDLSAIVEGVRRDPRGRFCLYGPPGTGKTGFGEHIARALDRPLLVKRGSDLLSKWLGETEHRIRALFREAEADQAVLLLDEADSFLRERTGALHSWEVTQVNELLTQMEGFDGLFIAATNLIDTLDAASLRRFDLKVRFDYLRPEQTWTLFREVLTAQGRRAPAKNVWLPRLETLTTVTPGDFAALVRRQRLASRPLTPEALLRGLEKEVALKPGGRARGIGFTAAV